MFLTHIEGTRKPPPIQIKKKTSNELRNISIGKQNMLLVNERSNYIAGIMVRVWINVDSNPGLVYTNDSKTGYFTTTMHMHAALMSAIKNWLARSQDNVVTESG
jgi:hypothetical protein